MTCFCGFLTVISTVLKIKKIYMSIYFLFLNLLYDSNKIGAIIFVEIITYFEL